MAFNFKGAVGAAFDTDKKKSKKKKKDGERRNEEKRARGASGGRSFSFKRAMRSFAGIDRGE